MAKYKYSGIGKHWGEWIDPAPEDREAWEYLTDDEERSGRDWVSRLWENPRLPEPFVPYFAYEFGWSHEEELHRSYLHALQRVTEPDEWVYAIDDPWSVSWFRFWPHRGGVHARWYASPVPNGDSQFFLAQDFSWAVLAFYEGMQHPDEGMYGQAIIDAFDAEPPPGWRARIYTCQKCGLMMTAESPRLRLEPASNGDPTAYCAKCFAR